MWRDNLPVVGAVKWALLVSLLSITLGDKRAPRPTYQYRTPNGYVRQSSSPSSNGGGPFYYKPVNAPSSSSSSSSGHNTRYVWRPSYSSTPSHSPSSSSSPNAYPSSSPPVYRQPQFRPHDGDAGGFRSNGGGGRNGRQALPEALSRAGYEKLGEMLTQAGLVETLSDRQRTFTVFAPTDDAIEEFLDSQSEETSQMLTRSRDALSSLLMNHVVPGTLTSADLVDGAALMALGGAELSVSRTRDGVVVGGALLSDDERLDLRAANGIVHGIEDVIFPFESSGKDERQIRPRLLGLDDDDPQLIVEVDGGRIRGINVDREVRAWLGIPYAKPPLGELRFAAPERVESWYDEGTLETREQPNACEQTPDTAFGDFQGATQWNAEEFSQVSEDCLYLNVHAPRNFTGQLPVLVWIYGGGYMTGSAALDLYDPGQYVRKDVIFVAMQYRLGSHGFLYMGERSGAPGNAGMLDQVMALEWVQDNIEAFGGNPDDVTIMGESAGANSVALHLVSPKSCRLFDKAILQSTGLTPRWGYASPTTSRTRAENLADALGCTVLPRFPESTVECLREVPSEKIRELEYAEDVVGPYTVNLYPWGPTTDGEFLLASPQRLLDEGAIANKPVLMGTNANEGYWSLMYFNPDLFPREELGVSDKAMTREQFKEQVDSVFSFYPESVRAVLVILYEDRYSGPDRFFRALDAMVAEADFVCNTEQMAQVMAEKGNDVYRYFYGHDSSQNLWPSYAGVKHGDEIEFTFGTPLSSPGQYFADEVGLAGDMVTYWTNFVKTGSPNPRYVRSWPEYSAPKWEFLNLTAELTSVGEGTMEKNCRFWIEALQSMLDDPLTEEEREQEDGADFGVCQ